MTHPRRTNSLKQVTWSLTRKDHNHHKRPYVVSLGVSPCSPLAPRPNGIGGSRRRMSGQRITPKWSSLVRWSCVMWSATAGASHGSRPVGGLLLLGDPSHILSRLTALVLCHQQTGADHA